MEVCTALGNPQLASGLVKQTHVAVYPAVLIAVLVALVVGLAFMYWVETVQIVLDLIVRWRRGKTGVDKKPSDIGITAEQEWRRVAARLLVQRYGIDSPVEPQQWAVWDFLLWNPAPEHTLRGPLFTMTTQATGWSGVAALCLAPGVRSWPFVVLIALLILTGLYDDLNRIKWLRIPSAHWLIALRTVLRSIPQPKPEQPKFDEQAD